MANITKQDLIKRVSDLEEELHVSQNSVDYWAEEADKYTILYENLKSELENNFLFQALKKCSLSQEIELRELIQKIQ